MRGASADSYGDIDAQNKEIGGYAMKIVVVRSPKFLTPLLLLIFKIPVQRQPE